MLTRFQFILLPFLICFCWTSLCLGTAELDWQIPQRYISWDQTAHSPIRWQFASHKENRKAENEKVVHVPQVPWIRLNLQGSRLVSSRAFIEIESELDGYRQVLNADSLNQWQSTSAYFNGDKVTVRLMYRDSSSVSISPTREYQNEEQDVLNIAGVFVGEVDVPPPVVVKPSLWSLCHGEDLRQLSWDKRVARLMPIGCTAWMIDDPNHCFLTAGHCWGSNFMGMNMTAAVQFQVPLSDVNGTVRHPHPNDQYPIDSESVQSDGATMGNDWAYMGAHPNSNTNLAPYKAQGEWYKLSQSEEVPDYNSTIVITGYGTTRLPNRHKNQVQQTHSGPLTASKRNDTRNLWHIRYQVDTTGGNSGSAIVLEETGEAIGVHAYAGCRWNRNGDASVGANEGTFIGHSSLKRALSSPKGVCATNRRLN